MVSKQIKNKTASSTPGSLSYKLLILAGFVVMFYIGYKLFQETYKQNQINVEIASLQQEVEKLNQDNQNLNELISYLQTDEFKEKEAREKLNLIKDGEHLVLVKEKEVAMDAPKAESQREAQVVVKRPNYYWWWHYYFSL